MISELLTFAAWSFVFAAFAIPLFMLVMSIWEHREKERRK